MAKPAPQGTTAYSSERFAHPFFVSAPPAARAPVHGARRMLDWSKTQLGPIPAPSNKGVCKLADFIGQTGTDEITQAGGLIFHALGDSGVNHATEAEAISDLMAADFKPDKKGANPAFLMHLGDVVYGPDKTHHYGERFYRPYMHYPGKILGIAGNHDGEVKSPADNPSLNAFRANFCANTETVPPQAAGSGIFRKTMILPGVFWMMDAPLARIIGLYSNRLENPGFLEGRTESGKPDLKQIQWLAPTLKAVAKANQQDPKALIVLSHHPPFSQGSHSGSSDMLATIDQACQATGVMPDAYLSGHAHNYQRYTRRQTVNGKTFEIPYIVAGTGGISFQPVVAATHQVVADATYDAAQSSYGFLTVTVKKDTLTIAFSSVTGPAGGALNNVTPFETIAVDLNTHKVSKLA